MKRVNKGQRGVTLIEMMFVVAIFAILAALAWGSLSSSRQDVEVRGMSANLYRTIMQLKFRAISSGLTQGLAINFNQADWVPNGNVTVPANSWTAFQGNIPCSALPCGGLLFGNEDSTQPAAILGPMASPGPGLQALSYVNVQGAGQAAGGGSAGYDSFADIWAAQRCQCELGNCGGCLNCNANPPEDVTVHWLVFLPNGTIIAPDVAPAGNLPGTFTIYAGIRNFITGTNAMCLNGVCGNTADPMNRPNRWRIIVYGNTGRVRLLRGWGDPLDPAPTSM